MIRRVRWRETGKAEIDGEEAAVIQGLKSVELYWNRDYWEFPLPPNTQTPNPRCTIPTQVYLCVKMNDKDTWTFINIFSLWL